MFQTLLHCRRLLCITCSRLRLYWNSKVKSFCFSLCPRRCLGFCSKVQNRFRKASIQALNADFVEGATLDNYVATNDWNGRKQNHHHFFFCFESPLFCGTSHGTFMSISSYYF